MFRARSIVGSVFALALLALPAKAVTTYNDPVVHPLFNLALYSGSAGGGIAGTPLLPNDPTGFVFTYTFAYTPPPTLLAITTTTNNIIGTTFGIANFTVSWVLQGFGTLASYPGSTVNAPLPLPIGGLYDLVLTGVANGSQGGFFNYTLFAECPNGQCIGETPVPGAVVLFGSVLAGGIGGMQLMRRRRMSRAA